MISLFYSLTLLPSPPPYSWDWWSIKQACPGYIMTRYGLCQIFDSDYPSLIPSELKITKFLETRCREFPKSSTFTTLVKPKHWIYDTNLQFVIQRAKMYCTPLKLYGELPHGFYSDVCLIPYRIPIGHPCTRKWLLKDMFIPQISYPIHIDRTV